jgi:hypothetical protein
MPRKSNKKPDANQIYVAADAVATGDGGVVRVGDRLRGDHRLVRMTWGENGQLWVPDGDADSAELGKRRVAIAAAGEAAARASYEFEAAPAPPRPIRDRDALVAIRAAGQVLGDAANADGTPLFVDKGTRVPRDSAIAKSDPDSFREVVPKGLTRERALVAKTDM